MTVVIVVHLDVMLVWDYLDSTLFRKKWEFKKKLRPTPLLWIVHRLAKYFRLAQLSHQFKKPRIKEGEEKIKNKKWVGHKVTEVTEPSNFGMLLHL